MKVMYKPYVYAFSACFMWAVMTPFVKQGIDWGFKPMNYAGFRFILAGLILLVATYRKGLYMQVLKHWRLFSTLIFVNMFMGCTAYYVGVSMISGSMASLVIGSAPLFNLVLIHFVAKNDKMNKYKLLSLPIGMLGVSLLAGLGNEGGALSIQGFIGIAFLLINILSNAYAGIKVAEKARELNPFFMNGVQMLAGGILIYFSAIYIEGWVPFWEMPFNLYPNIFILVMISVTAFSFWFKALKTPGVKVSNINMFLIINPIIGITMSILLLEDEMNAVLLSGLLIITFALCIYCMGERKASQCS